MGNRRGITRKGLCRMAAKSWNLILPTPLTMEVLILCRLLASLHLAHSVGLLHCDIHWSKNVLQFRKTWQLIDYGRSIFPSSRRCWILRFGTENWNTVRCGFGPRVRGMLLEYAHEWIEWEARWARRGNRRLWDAVPIDMWKPMNTVEPCQKVLSGIQRICSARALPSSRKSLENESISCPSILSYYAKQ
jgi:hypothetical protein